jgi:hypothetical protein
VSILGTHLKQIFLYRSRTMTVSSRTDHETYGKTAYITCSRYGFHQRRIFSCIDQDKIAIYKWNSNVSDVFGLAGQWQKSVWSSGMLPLEADSGSAGHSSLLQWSWDCEPETGGKSGGAAGDLHACCDIVFAFPQSQGNKFNTFHPVITRSTEICTHQV